jgi:hypothetical protein
MSTCQTQQRIIHFSENHVKGMHNLFYFLDKGLQNPASTSRDVHSQLLQTTAGLEIQQTKVKTRSID